LRYYSALEENWRVLLVDQKLKDNATHKGTRAEHSKVHTILTYGLREFNTRNEHISKATSKKIYSKIKALILEITGERINSCGGQKNKRIKNDEKGGTYTLVLSSCTSTILLPWPDTFAIIYLA
jgi:hypothetical protein